MSNIKRFFLVSLFASFAAAVGCSSGSSTPHEPNTTVVRLNPDGTSHVYHYYASPEQVARETAAKRAHQAQVANPNPVATPPGQTANPSLPSDQGGAGDERVGTVSEAISQDTGCAPTDMWIYSQSNLAGNRICFFGAGTANLWNYGFYLCDGGTCFWVYWARNVYSYYSGNESGYFTNPWNNEYFSTYSQANTNCGALPCNSLTLN